jgi:acyl-CoA dehydrogenase
MINDKNFLDQMIMTIRKFVDERLIPLEPFVSANDTIPEEIIAEMKQIGLFGLSIPERYSGLGLSMEEEVFVMLEIGRAAPAFRSVFGTNVGIGSQGILIDGTAVQKARYLPKMASGDLIGAFALTEPDVGSDAASVQTSAVKEGDAYIINGTKRFITNAPAAGLFTVMARTNPEEVGAYGISAFLVEADTPGIHLGKKEHKMGQQGAHVCDVIFENCRVPAEAIIGGVPGTGFKTAMKVLDRGRLNIASSCVGLAERILEDAVAYAKSRHQFGKPIAQFQLVQAMLADSKVEAYAGRTMVLDAARKYDAGEAIGTEASCCKLFASEMVGRVADRGVQIHGGNGYIAEYAIERLYRDVRLYRIYEGTSQIQQLIIARNMLRELA